MDESTSATLVVTAMGQQFNYYDIRDLALVNTIKQEIKCEEIDEVFNSLEDIKTEDNVLVPSKISLMEKFCRPKDNLNGTPESVVPVVKNLSYLETEAIENEDLLKLQDIKQENVELEIKVEEREISEVGKVDEEFDEFIKSEEICIKSEDRTSPTDIDQKEEVPLPHQNSKETVIYKCDKCSYETTAWNNISQHRSRHKYIKEDDLHKCSQCGFKSMGKALLNQHVLSKHSSRVDIHQCPFCDYKSIYTHNYKNHIKNRHTSIEQLDTFKCPECSFQTKYKHCLRNHSLWHKGPGDVNWLRCSKCDYETLYKANMKAHLFTHKRSKRPTIYKCALCEFKAPYQSLFRAHERRHQLKALGAVHRTEVLSELKQVEAKEAVIGQ